VGVSGRAVGAALARFVDEVGERGAVSVAGGRTKWHVGGALAAGARVVHAPVGVVAYEPAEMTVRAGAGTTLAELDDALRPCGQTTVLDGPPEATIGGTLATNANGIRRLRTGPLRDALLEARYVSAEGRLVTAGGPTVKNVTGYDLCRLHVGALGTLGLIGEVVLRTRPRPVSSRWLAGAADPELVVDALYRPACVLWDGSTTWALLEGYEVDVDAQASVARELGLLPVDGPPPLPPHRWSSSPAAVRAPAVGAAAFVAEMGVGVVHSSVPAPPRSVGREVRALHDRIKCEFDPTGRCNPGRDPLGVGAEAVE
jgi:FAD/FMN-containing dehydrogenase